jgi:hypothetical protein
MNGRSFRGTRPALFTYDEILINAKAVPPGPETNVPTAFASPLSDTALRAFE